MSTTDTANDFLRGQVDCQDNIPRKKKQSRSYERGYSTMEIAITIKTAGGSRHE